MTNNAAERAMRCVAVGRNNWTFAGSDAGGRRAAALYTLIESANLNDFDPRAWLAAVLARLQDHPARRIVEPSSCCPGTGNPSNSRTSAQRHSASQILLTPSTAQSGASAVCVRKA